MSATADASVQYPARDSRRNLRRFYAECAIGSTGAVGTTAKSDPALGFTRSAQGTYAVTYPAAPYAVVIPVLVVTDGTVISAYVSARSATAGTATIKTEDGGTPTVTDPEEGAVLGYIVETWDSYG